jgi:hypothetical protein
LDVVRVEAMRRALRLVFGTEVKTYQLCAVLGLGTD